MGALEAGLAAQVQQAEERMGALEAGLAAQVRRSEQSMSEIEERLVRVGNRASREHACESGGRGGKGKMMTRADMERVSERMRRVEDWAIEWGYHLMVPSYV